MEVIGQDIQTVIPYAAMAGGAAVGYVAELKAAHDIAKRSEPISAELGELAKAGVESKSRHYGRALRSTLVLGGAALGLMNGLVWQGEPAEQTTPRHLEVVVDHSGATALNDGKAVRETNMVAGLFTEENKIQAGAVLASSGLVREVKIANVDKDVPFGDAPMEQATLLALDKSKAYNTTAGNTNEKVENAGVLVLTNGNSVGNSANVIATATASKTPVFVVNVEAKTSDQATTEELKKIAKETGAKYWGANDENIEDVKDQVKDALETGKENRKSNNRWPLRIVAGTLTAFSAAFIYNNRSKEPIGRWLKARS